MPLLMASSLGQRLGGKWVYKGLSLEVEPSQAVLLLGPNGCGKTTLLRTLAVLIQPSEGKVEINGLSTKTESRKARQFTAFMAAYPSFYDELTVQENLALFVAARHGKAQQNEIQTCAEGLGLDSRLNQRFRTLSSGWKKRTALALMALSKAPLWFLDEPETTLDQDGLGWLLDSLRTHLGQGGAAVIATHQKGTLSELQTRSLKVTQKALEDVSC